MEGSGNHYDPSGNSVNGGLEDSVGSVRVVGFEMDAEVVHENDKLDRVVDRGEYFVYGDEEEDVAQWGALKDPTGLVVGRSEVIGNSDLE